MIHDAAIAPDMISSSSLPPADSPLTKAFVGPYLGRLMKETITFRRISFAELGADLSFSDVLLKEAVEGQIALTRGQWLRLVQKLRLPANIEFQIGQRNEAPCWEVGYPPVPVAGIKRSE
jgi:hypothetical protein